MPHHRLWPLVGGLILACIYLPTLGAPFDFIDDGNLVYPAPAGTTAAGHVARYGDKVAANVEHLGPFRPVLWAHWELAANLFGGDALCWRAARLAWCALAGAAFLALARALNLPPVAAFVAGLSAVVNPYRNEIWTSLTLAEGVAMPYCMVALWSARRAAGSRLGGWDALGLVCFLAALGCKNTYAALAPALVALRSLPDGLAWKLAVRANWTRAAVYLLPLALPAIHFVYFKLNWKPGQYETPGPSAAQLLKMLGWLKGTAGADFLAAGIAVLLAGVVLAHRTVKDTPDTTGSRPNHDRALVVCAILLFGAGICVYLPLPMMAARYTMPAVWGLDLALGLLVTKSLAGPPSDLRRAGLLALAVGIGFMAAANVGRQSKVAARSQLLWDALHHVEATAFPGARIEWVSGPTGAKMLNAEEGIHFRWHLLHRDRGDITVNLVDTAGDPIERVELPAPTGPADYRVAMGASGEGTPFGRRYWLGRKRFDCRVERLRRVPPSPGMGDAELLGVLMPARTSSPATAELKPGRERGEGRR